MSTVLYHSPIFGPVHSRRLGVSLGINLMPADGKLCSFDCIYCECGFNKDFRTTTRRPSREDVYVALESVLREMMSDGLLPDVLTFAGNGEPTAHPQFKEIIDDTIALRDKYCPKSHVSVLTNATFIGRQNVFDALMRVDNNILKLDTADDSYIKLVDRPASANYTVQEQVANMKKFNGHCIIQTMFMKGTFEGKDVNNVKPEYIGPWLKAVAEIRPRQVMIYTIDRETPDKELVKASKEDLDTIVRQVELLGIPATASY